MWIVVSEIYGVKGKDKFLPHLLGHEGTEIIINKHKILNVLKLVIKLFCTGKSHGLNSNQNTLIRIKK